MTKNETHDLGDAAALAGGSTKGIKSRAFEIAADELNAERRASKSESEIESSDSVKKIFYGRR